MRRRPTTVAFEFDDELDARWALDVMPPTATVQQRLSLYGRPGWFVIVPCASQTEARRQQALLRMARQHRREKRGDAGWRHDDVRRT